MGLKRNKLSINLKVPLKALKKDVSLSQIEDMNPFSSYMYEGTQLIQLVEHCTGMAEVMDSNPIKATWLFQVYIKATIA